MNKTFSKILSLILAVVLAVGTFGVGEFCIRAGALTYGDWEYKIYTEYYADDYRGIYTVEHAIITKYNGTDAIVEIPSNFAGKPVKEIDEKAFEKNKYITEVSFPSSITLIREDAFSGCTSLKTINFSEGQKWIYEAFKRTAVEKVTIPSTVIRFSSDAFAGGCIKEIVFEDDYVTGCAIGGLSTKALDENALLMFKGFPSVDTDRQLRAANYQFFMKDGYYCYKPDYSNTVPETFTCGDYTYTLNSGEVTIVRYNNFEAEEVIVPQTLDGYPVTTIGEFAFSSVSGLENTWYDTINSYTYKFKKITLPEGLKKIERYAFAENETLVEVVVPESLQSFGYCAFLWSRNLEKINIPDGIEILPDYLFGGLLKIETTLPDSLKIVCTGAIRIRNRENEITGEEEFNAYLPDSVEYLGANIFASSTIEEVTLPKNLQEMRETFADVKSLKKVVFNDCLRVIGFATFSGCVNLEEAILPESVTNIDEMSFFACEKLTKVYLPAGVKYIPEEAFAWCTSLNSFEWSSDEKNIEPEAFFKCPLEGFDFSNIRGIADGAFYASSIVNVKIGQGDYEADEKQSIGAQSFKCCSELQTVSLGGNVNEIGSQAFAECGNLETVVIADSVEIIAEDAFENSENVTIYCFENSYAETFAIENNIKVTTLVVDPIPNQTYTTKEIKPELKVSMSSQKLDKFDYTAEFYNNVDVGTAGVIVTGKGDFDMLVSKAEFAIVAKNISDVQISKISPQTYDNDIAVTPDVALKYNGVTLNAGIDYELSYSNNHSVGTATVTIKGLGNYKGTTTVNFEIVDEEDSAIKRFFNSITDFLLSAWNWLFGLFM